MKHSPLLISIISSLLWSSCISPGHIRQTEVIETRAEAMTEKPFLWQVQKENYPTSYLFGTIHVGVKSTEIADIVWAKWKQSEQVIVEADIINISPSHIRQVTQLPAHQSMEHLLGKDYWDSLQKLLPNIDPIVLDRMSPYAILNALSMQDTLQHTSMDLDFQRRSRDEEKHLVFLEAVEFQIELLNSILGIDALKAHIDKRPDTKAVLQKYRSTYLEGNLEKIRQLVEAPPESNLQLSEEDLKKLMDERNRNWSTILVPLFRRGKSFIAVGVGHLTGPNNLLQLLRNRGFQISRFPDGPKNTSPNRSDI